MKIKRHFILLISLFLYLPTNAFAEAYLCQSEIYEDAVESFVLHIKSEDTARLTNTFTESDEVKISKCEFQRKNGFIDTSLEEDFSKAMRFDCEDAEEGEPIIIAINGTKKESLNAIVFALDDPTYFSFDMCIKLKD